MYPLEPEKLRPISVLSVWYRLWSSYSYRSLGTELHQRFPDTLLGGIPGRSGSAMVTTLQSRIEATLMSGEPIAFSVASLDATKCFDHMLHHVALRTAQLHGLPVRLIRALGAFYTYQARRYSSGGYLDRECVNPLRGFNQGDALSVWITNSEVESWQRSLPESVIPMKRVSSLKVLGVEVGLKRPLLDVQGLRTATAIRTSDRVERL
eukprot:37829-Amphidinium_carterae.1